MKKTIAIVVTTVLLSGVNALAQGTIFFANRLSAAIFAPVYLSDGTSPVTGSGYSAQLFAGPAAGSLAAIDSPLPFRGAGAGAGSWAGFQVTIPTVAPGGVAALQVRAWNNGGGTAASYAAAVAGGLENGQSAVFNSEPLGGGSPPAAAPNMIGTANAANSMTSFNLSPGTIVPEPSVLALGVLGGLALLIRRRK